MFRGAKILSAWLRAALLAALCMLAPSPATAQGANSGFTYHSDVPCHTIVSPDETMAEVARDAERWSCEAIDALPDGTEQIALRFDLSGTGIAEPGLLVNSHTYREFDTFARFEIVTIGQSEVAASGWLTVEEFLPTSPVWKTRIVAPTIVGEPQALVVRIDAPARAGVLDRFDLVDTAPTALIANSHQLIAAVLCGLLLAPAFIGLGHYRALRSRFAIYHVVYCLLAVIQVAALGGLLPLMMEISRKAQFIILHMSFDLVAATSAIFAASFIERDKISPSSRKVLHCVAVLAIILGLMRVSLGLVIGQEIAIIYYAGYAVFLLGLAFALIHPLRQNSRAAWFLMASYMPLVLIGVIRVGLALITDFEIRFHAVLLQHFSLSWQVVVSAFAVADRFLIIRRERDRARTAATLMERASERDSLTGLYNRRILTERFERLHAEGFTSLALIDLDHFKSANDTFGHGAGDDVLRAVAKALKPDNDTIVVRMGGEEFALLLRGEDAFGRAEERRIAVAAASREALGGEQEVTASMGLVEQEADAPLNTGFASLYDRADRLLYEAKNAGRDRAISEKLRLFRQRQAPDRRRSREAA